MARARQPTRRKVALVQGSVRNGREERRLERDRRRLRSTALTLLRVIGYAALISAAFYVCGFMVFMVVS